MLRSSVSLCLCLCRVLWFSLSSPSSLTLVFWTLSFLVGCCCLRVASIPTQPTTSTTITTPSSCSWFSLEGSLYFVTLHSSRVCFIYWRWKNERTNVRKISDERWLWHRLLLWVVSFSRVSTVVCCVFTSLYNYPAAALKVFVSGWHDIHRHSVGWFIQKDK